MPPFSVSCTQARACWLCLHSHGQCSSCSAVARLSQALLPIPLRTDDLGHLQLLKGCPCLALQHEQFGGNTSSPSPLSPCGPASSGGQEGREGAQDGEQVMQRPQAIQPRGASPLFLDSHPERPAVRDGRNHQTPRLSPAWLCSGPRRPQECISTLGSHQAWAACWCSNTGAVPPGGPVHPASHPCRPSNPQLPPSRVPLQLPVPGSLPPAISCRPGPQL